MIYTDAYALYRLLYCYDTLYDTDIDSFFAMILISVSFGLVAMILVSYDSDGFCYANK